MPKQAGDALHASTETIGHPDPDETTEPGDAVSLDASGNCQPAGADDELVGVRSRNRQTRDVASLHTEGTTIAKVATGVEAGDGLAPSAEAGELAAAAGGPAQALSDEGGEYRGASIEDGYAAVLLRTGGGADEA